MTFSPLETMLISAVLSVFVGVVVRLQSVTPKFCEDRRKVDAESRENIEKMLAEVKRTNDIQFHMLRAIVLELNISPEKKQELMKISMQVSS